MPPNRDDATDSIVRFPGIGLQSGGLSGMLVAWGDEEGIG